MLQIGRYYLLLCLGCALYGNCRAQEIVSPSRTHNYIEEYLRQRVDFGALGQEQATELLDRVDYLLAHPLDINRIQLEDLHQIPHLSEYQAYQFIHYRTNHDNQFTSLYDLKLIPGWDEETIGWILPLFRYNPTEKKVSLGTLIEDGKATLGMFSSLSNKKGDTKPREYLGNNLHWGLQWHWKSGDDLSAFVAAEQDRGEPFRYRRHLGADSYTFHVKIRRGLIQQLVLGDYRVSWGEGLVINQGYFKVRNTFSNRIPTAEGIRPVTGWSEANKNRGIALSLGRDRFSISFIGSLRSLDGNVREGMITALTEGGLHRTPTEWRRRGAVLFRQWGGRMSYSIGNLQLALQALGYDWAGNTLVRPAGTSGNKKLENLRSQSNTSVSYHYHNRSGSLHLFGEVARSSLEAWATTHRLSYFSESWGMLNFSARYIDANYWSYYGMGHTHYSHIHNERGVMLDYTSPRIRDWEWRFFGDYYSSPQPRLRSASRGVRLSSQLVYASQSPLSIRLLTSIYHQPDLKQRRSLSSFLTYQGIPKWKISANLSLSQEKEERGAKTLSPLAYALSMGVEHQPSESVKLILYSTHYRVPQGVQALYLSTPRLNYDTQTTFLRGRGFRLSLLGKFRFGKHWYLGSSASLVFPSRGEPRGQEQLLSLNLIYR